MGAKLQVTDHSFKYRIAEAIRAIQVKTRGHLGTDRTDLSRTRTCYEGLNTILVISFWLCHVVHA
ncbi:hypothetical protein ACCUM_2899 [Candidatus Accumulibacter phosphatis]|uniref:Uncharacterized protein n=1 Tax=Candidatus Accumulibacter phosphatis TaxID=327160 RepID=A0A5S4EHP3_9PROT|nr:hypothetical protein ACCUM_2899 [Candidatus Accumulibacter phosphatis]